MLPHIYTPVTMPDINKEYQEFRKEKITKIVEHVKEFRTNDLDYSLRDLVDGIDITRSNMSMYETRKIGLTNILLYVYRAKGEQRNKLVDELAAILKEEV